MNFDKKMEAIRNLSNHLVDYNYPLSPMDFEYDISCLKKTEVEADGYSLAIHFNKSFYGTYYLETFQLFNMRAPFLPFYLVAKLGKKALGSHFLSLVEFYQQDHKVYCWSVCVDDTGKPIASPLNKEIQVKIFEGFEYGYMHPEQLNLY